MDLTIVAVLNGMVRNVRTDVIRNELRDYEQSSF